ncbi:MAG: O-antigen ligase family protein [Anaerolineales bacterium]
MRKVIQHVRNVLMIVFFVSLPLTNFPFFPPSFGGNSAVVRPFLIYPLLGLVVLVTLPRLLSDSLPKPILIILIFFLVASISSLLVYFRGVQSPWREVSVFSRELRTIITLGLAISIYLTVTLFMQKGDDLRFSLRWIYVGLIMVLVWGTLQAIYMVNIIPGWFEIMNGLQSFVTNRALYPTRISGMTYEPTAFADQIVVLWLPLLLGTSLTDYTVFGWRWKWLTVEKILLPWTMGILAFTLSRTGLVLGVGLIVFTVILKIIDQLSNRRAADDKITCVTDRKGSRVFFGQLSSRYVLLIVLGVLIFLTLFFILGARSDYISRVWEYWTGSGDKDLRKYFTYIGFGSRMAYWQAAYNMYADHPIFGVGLGNFTVYLADYVPFQHLAKTPEVLRHLVPKQGRSRVQTVKHFLLRILAETGLVGTGIFLTFVVVLLAGSVYLWLSKDEEEHFWGTIAILGMAGFIVDTFSYDSFAIPNPWVMFGIVTAAFRIFTAKMNGEEILS